jgi:hypothetical protein
MGVGSVTLVVGSLCAPGCGGSDGVRHDGWLLILAVLSLVFVVPEGHCVFAQRCTPGSTDAFNVTVSHWLNH